MRLIRRFRETSVQELGGLLDMLPLDLGVELGKNQIKEWKEKNGQQGIHFEFPQVRSQKNQGFGPEKEDRLLGRNKPLIGADEISELFEIPCERGSSGGIEISSQVCSFCRSKGTLTIESKDLGTCPRCKKPLSEIGDWVT